MICIFLGTNISHLEENKILVIDSTVPEEAARKVTGTMVQDGVIFFCLWLSGGNSENLPGGSTFISSHWFSLWCFFFERAFKQCQDKCVKQKHMGYRLHHLQLEGVRAKIQQISQKLGGVWEPDCRMRNHRKSFWGGCGWCCSQAFCPPFFSKTFRKTLSGNTFQNPQVKKISEVLFLVFFMFSLIFAKRHVHVLALLGLHLSLCLHFCRQPLLLHGSWRQGAAADPGCTLL